MDNPIHFSLKWLKCIGSVPLNDLRCEEFRGCVHCEVHDWVPLLSNHRNTCRRTGAGWERTCASVAASSCSTLEGCTRRQSRAPRSEDLHATGACAMTSCRARQRYLCKKHNQFQNNLHSLLQTTRTGCLGATRAVDREIFSIPIRIDQRGFDHESESIPANFLQFLPFFCSLNLVLT